MLKAHQACIDLEKNVLRIQGSEVPFLAEHELPEKARMEHVAGEELEEPGHQQPRPSTSQPQRPHQPTSASGSRGGAPSFPGSGSTLGSRPSAAAAAPHHPRQQAAPAAQFPENDIATLVNLGVTRDEAVRMLEAAGGNVEVAASLLF